MASAKKIAPPASAAIAGGGCVAGLPSTASSWFSNDVAGVIPTVDIAILLKMTIRNPRLNQTARAALTA